jgi:pilus assembly protein Flp/PilA
MLMLCVFQRNEALLEICKYMALWLKLDDEQGVTAIEYGLIAALIALAIIVGVGLVGTNLSTLFNAIAGQLVAPAG